MRRSSQGGKTGKTTNQSSQKKVNTNSTNKPNAKIKPDLNTANSKQKKISVPVSSAVSKVPSRPSANIPKYPLQKKEEPVKSRYMKKKQQPMKQHKWGYLSFSYLTTIFPYACSTLFEVYQMSRVCSVWRAHLQSQQGCYLWNYLKEGQNIYNFAQLKLYLQKFIVQQQQKMSFQFEKQFTKLFNYGSTKQNIANKLIEKLNLEIEVKLNNINFIQPFKLRTFNFSSYLCAKIEQIREFKYDFYSPHNMFKDKILLEMNFRSRRYKVSHSICKKYIPEQIVDAAIKQKAFNYFLDKNFVFTYFEGDNNFLYIFFEISLLQLVNIFRSIIKKKHQDSLDKKIKKQPLYKQLCETQFEDFVQYVKFQADFEVHFSYHNSLKQIFTHCDTKVFPIQYDNKHASFYIKVDDTFDKIATYKLDNKMGMSQSIDNLYLLDFVLKDRDRFLIIFSGFIYARKANQKERESLDNYFQFAENEIKIIQSKQQKYQISFLIVQQQKRNFMKYVKFKLFA